MQEQLKYAGATKTCRSNENNVRKDMTAGFDKLGMQMTIRLGLMVAAAVSIIAAILKM